MSTERHEPIPRLPRTGVYPLSAAQRGAWLREKLYPGERFYTVLRTLELVGPLDVARLHRALAGWVGRHDVLRGVFVEIEGEPWVRVVPTAVPLPRIDLSALPANRRDAEVDCGIRRLLRRPFELARGPLFRFRLFRGSERRHWLLTSFHHAVIDGFSLSPMVDELEALYLGRPLPPHGLQYQDYAAWQRTRLDGAALDEARDHWRRRLAGELPVLDLPRDRVRPPLPGYEGGTVVCLLDARLRDRVKALRRELGSSVFRTLLAAAAVLLHRITGGTDLIVGSPLAGRVHPDLARMIGFFVTTPGLRLDLTGDPSFTEVVARVGAEVTAAVEHQEYPWEAVLEWIGAARDRSRPPVYSVVFGQRPVVPPRSFGDLELRHWELFLHIAPYDLTFAERETADGLQVAFIHSRLFERRSVESWAASYRRLLESALDGPGTPISRLDLVTGTERAQIALTRGAAPLPSDVGEEFARRVRERPDAVAAVAGGEQVSYSALAARAGGIARRLRRLEAGPEARVGVLGECGIGLLAAILGVCEAGAAWVPLDPGEGDERLAAQVEAADVRWIVTGRAQAPRVAALARRAGRQLALVDRDEPAVVRRAAVAAASPRRPPPGGLAAVLPSAGTATGPRGALIEHRGLLAQAEARVRALGLGARDVVAVTAPHRLGLRSLLAPLLAGCRVAFAAAEAPVDIAAELEALAATVLETGPDRLAGLAGVIASGGNRRRLPALRLAVSSGDLLPVPWVGRWLKRLPGTSLVDAYGPAEAVGVATFCTIATPPPAGALRVGTGRPATGLEVLVLDRALRPVPEGSPGRIALAGAGVGRGYAGEPATTAAAFVPHPFPTEPGQRLLLTDDRGRLRAGAELEVYGRQGRQVPVRGFAVDLAEVEAALLAVPGVARAVAVRFEDGAPRLVGYYAAERHLAVDRLRAALEESLPAYMVPEQLVELAEPPLDALGRIDSRRLPPPPRAASTATPPRDELERRIAAIWAEVLGVEPIGVEDEFFALGGHSLKAIQVATRLRHELGLEVRVTELFGAATVARLAAARRHPAAPPAPAADRIPRLAPAESYRLSPAQEAQWFAAQMVGEGGGKLPEILELTGPLDRAALLGAVSDLLTRHAELRTTFVDRGGEPRQRLHPPFPLPVPEVDLRALAPRPVRHALARCLDEASRPFDLEAGPLLRARLVRLGRARQLLLLNVPHVVSDGWSEQVMLQDLASLYRARRGTGPPPAPPRLRYVDFAAWQHDRLTGPLSAQREYWLGRFRDAPPPPDLGGGEGVDGEGRASGELATRALTAARTRRALELAERCGATPFALFVAALAAVLARWTGAPELVVGSALAGRTRLDTEGMVGVFINPVALRVDLAGDPAFAELVGRVHGTVVEAIAHQDYPFHRWLEELRRRRREGGYRPFSVVAMVHEKPVLAPFDGLEARYLRASELIGAEALARTLGRFGGDAELRLDVLRDDQGVTLVASSGTGRSSRRALERLVGQLDRLLEQVPSAPERPLSRLRLLTEEDRDQVDAWSRGGAVRPDPGLMAAVEASAAAGAEHGLAVIDAGGRARADADARLFDPKELGRHLVRHRAASLAVAAEAGELVTAALEERAALAPGAPPRVVWICSRGARPPAGADGTVFHPVGSGAAGLWSEIGTAFPPRVRCAGRPVPEHPLQVLDAAGEPVPAGVVGTISWRGAESGATGWRGRWRDDGVLEVLAWPAPPPEPRPRTSAYRAPRSAIERGVAAVWCRVLGFDRVGVDDDFFALGGTLVTAATAVRELCREGWPALPGEIDARRTVADLALAIARSLELAEAPAEEAPLTPLQRALLALALEKPRTVVRTAWFRSDDGLDPADLQRLLDALMRRHDALRAEPRRDGGLWLLGFCSTAEPPLAVIDSGAGAGSDLSAWAAALADQIDPAGGLQWRALACRSKDGAVRRLALAASTLVVDERSWLVLAAELAAGAGAPSAELTALPGRSFAAWLQVADRLRAGTAASGGWRLTEPWTESRRLHPRGAPSAVAERLRAALGRLPATLEETAGRGDLGVVRRSDLSTLVGQLESLPEPLAAGGGAGPRIRITRAVARDLEPARPPLLALERAPEPRRLIAQPGAEPDAWLELTEGAAPELALSLRVASGLDVAWLTTRLTALLDEENSAVALPRGLETVNVELEEADLEDLLR